MWIGTVSRLRPILKLRDSLAALPSPIWPLQGFQVIATTVGEMANPKKELMKAILHAIGFTTILNVGLDLVVFWKPIIEYAKCLRAISICVHYLLNYDIAELLRQSKGDVLSSSFR